MKGPHDIGGTRGLGPVPIEQDEPVFHEPWEGRALGVTLATAVRQLFPIDEHRATLGRQHPTAYRAMKYYEQWMTATERVLVNHGVLSDEEIEERLHQVEEDPDRPLPEREDEQGLGMIRAVLEHGIPFVLERDDEPRFAPGDAVTARSYPGSETEGIRLPAYVQGRPGTVVLVHPPLAFADIAVAGEGMVPDYVYGVRFRSRDLWPDAGERDTVVVDLFERYLVPGGDATAGADAKEAS